MGLVISFYLDLFYTTFQLLAHVPLLRTTVLCE